MNDGDKPRQDMQQRLAQLEFGLRHIMKLAQASNTHLRQFAAGLDQNQDISRLRAAAEANALILGYGSDLTLEDNYNRNQRRLASLFQHMINGFTYCRALRDEKGDIEDILFLEANKAFHKMMGKKPAEIINQKFKKIFPIPRACDSILSLVKKLDRHGGTLESEEFFAPLNKWFMISAFSTEKNYFALLLYDITSRKKTENKLSTALAQATQANKAKDHFLATLSHDIRTPLSTIHNVTELLGGSAMDEEAQKYVQLISSSCNHLLLMIEEILDAYATDKVSPQLGEIPFSPVGNINSYFQGMKQAAEQKGLRLNLFLDPNIPETISGDPAKFGRIFYNLIGNAIKFTANGGVQVGVTYFPPGHGSGKSSLCRLLLEIRDTGIGIPQESLDSIFEPYARVARHDATPKTGSGLGLSITSDIVRKMGGEICVDSVPGKGSTFYCLLPLKNAETLPQSDKASDLKTFFDDLSLLVIDDNALHADTTAALLGQFVGRVRTAYSGAEAIAKLENGDVNMILLDLSLPDMNGFSLTSKIRKGLVPGCKTNIYIAALTGHALPEHRDQCLAAGMNAYMVKPFSKKIFINMLRPMFMRQAAAEKSNPSPERQDHDESNEFAPDYAALNREFSGHEAMISDLLARFLKNHGRPMKELGKAVADSDNERIRDRAHYIKTSFLTIQAKGCAALASQLEQAAKQGNSDSTESLYESLSKALEQCVLNIKERL